MSETAQKPRRKRIIRDVEIRALRDAWDLLATFDLPTRRRMLNWLNGVSESRRELPPVPRGAVKGKGA